MCFIDGKLQFALFQLGYDDNFDLFDHAGHACHHSLLTKPVADFKGVISKLPAVVL